jgi:hypothetical protein
MFFFSYGYDLIVLKRKAKRYNKSNSIVNTLNSLTFDK